MRETEVKSEIPVEMRMTVVKAFQRTAMLALVLLPCTAMSHAQEIQESELKKKIAADNQCEVAQITLWHLEKFDYAGDSSEGTIVIAFTCNTGTAGPDVHSVFDRDSEGELVELKIADADPKTFDSLFGNRNYDLTAKDGLLVATWHDGTERERPLTIKYKWNGKEFAVTSIEKAGRFKTSYDCDKAQDEVERAVCYVKGLADLDLELHAMYQALLTKLPEAQKQTMRTEQRKWIVERRNRCVIYKSTDEVEACYRKRIAELKKLIADADQHSRN